MPLPDTVEALLATYEVRTSRQPPPSRLQAVRKIEDVQFWVLHNVIHVRHPVTSEI